MNGDNLTNKSLVFGIIFLLFGMAIIPSINSNAIGVNDINGNSEHQDISSFLGDGILDSKYIYNITKALSHIIFTEYNETAGELAKVRSTAEETDMEVPRKSRRKNRSGEIEGRIIFCHNEKRESTKER